MSLFRKFILNIGTNWWNKDQVKTAIEKDGLNLKFASKALRADREVVELAIEKNIWAIHYADDSLLKDKNFMTLAILIGAVVADRGSEIALRYAKDEIKSDKEIMLKAIESNAFALTYASDSLRSDPEVIEFFEKHHPDWKGGHEKHTGPLDNIQHLYQSTFDERWKMPWEDFN